MRVRPPAVAGQFYPDDPARLRSTVQAMLDRAPEPGGAAPKALIAPHAGYVYSGPIAAAAFVALGTARTITRLVVIGPAHYVWFRGIAAPQAQAFDTPLGRLPVDEEALDAIVDLPFVSKTDGPHAPEHALEVELPFAQQLLASFTIVPLAVGDARPQEVAEVLSRLWGGEETAIVVSSDLSHYHDYETARRRDARTAAAIEGGDWDAIDAEDACGHLPIAGLLIEAGRHGLQARRLALANSGDTAGPRDRVVGYGAWGFEPATGQG